MPFMHRTLGILLVSLLFSAITRAQDTLPRFSATARGTGKILISWHNHYPVVNQISVQRSTDSLKNFTTLITVPDPTLPANGITDSKAPHPNFYYRLFIVLDNGRYLFTPSRRPRSNTGEPIAAAAEADDNADKEAGTAKMENTRILFVDPALEKGKPLVKPPSSVHNTLPAIEVNTSVFVRRGDSLVGKIAGGRLGHFRDSLLGQTRDTLVFIDGDTLLIKPFVPKEVYRVSSYVFTAKYGNIQLSLPEAARKHYAVKFFDENNKLLFELSEIKDPSLTIDKTNFQHSGWFRFELYEGNQLKEKNKLFIPKEF
ncbi:MAG TPA: hypothetical protein VGM30_01665 [Puia sp.]